MPDQLSSVVLSGTSYAASATISDVWGAAGGSFDIQNGNVFYTLQYGGVGLNWWTPEAPASPGGGPIPAGISGIQFRNQSAASPATVSATLALPNHPVLAISYTRSLPTSVITGVVAANGTVTAGTGFTVNRTGVGVYVVTFTSAFPASPLILTTQVDSATPRDIRVTAVSSASFTAAPADENGAAIDRAFNFLAQAVT